MCVSDPRPTASATGRSQVRQPAHLHQAETAHAGGLETFVIAERRHLDARVTARLENGAALQRFNRSTVDRQVCHGKVSS